MFLTIRKSIESVKMFSARTESVLELFTVDPYRRVRGLPSLPSCFIWKNDALGAKVRSNPAIEERLSLQKAPEYS
jgi:hypothetical protein